MASSELWTQGAMLSFLLLLLTPLLNLPPRPAMTPAVQSALAAASAPVAPAPMVTTLRSELEGLLGRAGGDEDQWAVLVVSLDRGDTLFAHAPDLPLAPASNMKLFTSAAGLYYLGPDFRYGTYLLTDGRIAGGILYGDLIVYGTGDPTLSGRFYESKLTVWEAFADSLEALGIREIRGDVVGDGSYFDGLATGVGWQQDYMNAWYAAPADALSFNDNMVTLHIRPGDQAGWRPEVQFIPGGRGIAIVNQATTTAGGRTWIHVDRAAYDGPIVIEGHISAGHSGVWRAVPVADPPRYAATVLHQVLEERGIAVSGGVRSIHAPDDSPITARNVFAPAFADSARIRTLAVHRSPRLLDILEVVNKDSHNFYAEQVLRTVGRVALGDGSVRGGARAVHALLERETRVADPTLRMLDGSGLSALNRVDPRTVIALLDYMARSPYWDAFWSTLPEAGNSRGLRRMYRTDAAQNLRAKTGTIDDVSALSGYVRAANGERLAFSIISNDVRSTWQAKRVEDAIGARLASFSRPRTASPVVAATAAQVMDSAGTADVTGSVSAASSAVAANRTPSADDEDANRVHVIRSGDTLEEIAEHYGTTVRALERANPGVEPRRLIPGRTLHLP